MNTRAEIKSILSFIFSAAPDFKSRSADVDKESTLLISLFRLQSLRDKKDPDKRFLFFLEENKMNFFAKFIADDLFFDEIVIKMCTQIHKYLNTQFQ